MDTPENDQTERMDLTGQLLLAMPGMGDPLFENSVIYICSHEVGGAMGLIVNKPAVDLSLSDVLDQIADGAPEDTSDLGVYFGGPVETGRGFVLHSDDYRSAIKTQCVAGGFALTATLDVLEDIAVGKGPDKALLMLGHAGWGPDQLEGEIVRNGWLTCKADPALVFDLPDDRKWSAALQSMGIDPTGLSAVAGRA
jgi:putative transcriptional regulator